MGLQRLKEISFGVFLVSVVLEMVLSLILIWGERIGCCHDMELVMRAWLTVGVLLLASALALTAAKTMQNHAPKTPPEGQ